MSGDWSEASNWSEAVPTSTIDADIDVSGTYVVTISDDEAASSLTISDAGATLSLAGSNTLTLSTVKNHGTLEALGSSSNFTVKSSTPQ